MLFQKRNINAKYGLTNALKEFVLEQEHQEEDFFYMMIFSWYYDIIFIFYNILIWQEHVEDPGEVFLWW